MWQSWYLIAGNVSYRISSNNSRPSTNRLSRIIPTPSLAIFSSFYHLLVKLNCKVIQQNWSATIQALKINQYSSNNHPGYYSGKYGVLKLEA